MLGSPVIFGPSTVPSCLRPSALLYLVLKILTDHTIISRSDLYLFIYNGLMLQSVVSTFISPIRFLSIVLLLGLVSILDSLGVVSLLRMQIGDLLFLV
jgi:hypothetical protein